MGDLRAGVEVKTLRDLLLFLLCLPFLFIAVCFAPMWLDD